MMKTKLPLLLACLLFATCAQAQLPVLPGQQSETAPVPDAKAPMYRHTGEQYRVYEFPGTGEPIPYRLFVPENWTPEQQLPVLITLRAGTSINNNHRDNNDLIRLARERGYIVISPLGYRGYRQPYYGSPYPVDRPMGPSVPAEGWTAEENMRAEQDVINVLSLVSAEYNADPARVFVHGQNPSGSSAFHFAAKYPDLISAIVVSSGPIITTNYPFENLKDKVAVMMLHGDKDVMNTVAASERVTKELQEHGVEAEYHTVPGGEHLNAYLLYAKEFFDFLDKH
ncbi:MAG: alpha/beta hydrolase-fold protein [Pseudomonadota bacterium]